MFNMQYFKKFYRSLQDKKPNIIIVMADELRQQSVGSIKSDPVLTPTLDDFCSSSLVLKHAISNSPICSPARAIMFSGKYPLTNGVVDNCYSKTIPYGIELSTNEICWSDVLKKNGYSLGYIGKYHLDLPNPNHVEYTEGWRGDPNKGGTLWDAYTPPGPRRHGFDFWYSYGCCDNHLHPHYWVGNSPVSHRVDINQWSVEHETDIAIDFLMNKGFKYRPKDKPFCLMVSFNPPHMPFELVPDKYKKLYQDISSSNLLTRENVPSNRNDWFVNQAHEGVNNYFAAITGIDENFGRILEFLKNNDLEENTIVIFMSDHGEMLGSHGRMGKNIWYDESLFIPFIIRWPIKIKPRIEDKLIFNMADFFPTLLGLIGLKDPSYLSLEGFNRSDIFLDASLPISTNSGPFIGAQPFYIEERRGVITLDYTFVISKNREDQSVKKYLFDRKNDEFQLKNISFDNDDALISCLDELKFWLSRTRDDWGVRNNIFI